MTTRTNISRVIQEIRQVAETWGRPAEQITLVAVTKAFPVEYMLDAYNAHLRTMAESRVQEADAKIPKFKYRNDIDLHFIGHLQRNKVQKAVSLFDIIQSVDSIRLAKRISDMAIRLEKRQKIYLQVNTGKDEKKFGIDPENAVNTAKEISGYPGIELGGLMVIAPMVDDKSILHKVFSRTRKIRDDILDAGIQSCMALSMGMSNDFKIAIQEGATHVRIGRALFGERPQWKPSVPVN